MGYYWNSTKPQSFSTLTEHTLTKYYVVWKPNQIGGQSHVASHSLLSIAIYIYGVPNVCV